MEVTSIDTKGNEDMRVSEKVSCDVDLDEVYSMCNPIDRKVCLKFIREFVARMLRFRAEDSDGGWMFPNSELIAGNLIDAGLATGEIVD